MLFFKLSWVLLFCSRTCLALVVPSGATFKAAVLQSQDENFFKISINFPVRVRSTIETDLGDVANLLADATVKAKAAKNWKRSMETLRRKASLRAQLSYRFNAVREGRRVMRQAHRRKAEMPSRDSLEAWWSSDALRDKIAKAAGASREPHLWKEHNFALTPSDISLLQHKLMTAEDIKTGKVVGFCEIAMLAGPDVRQEHALPTVVNLVCCPNHRRLGIASQLITSALCYTKCNWPRCHALSLYVDEGNTAAASLYNKFGFKKRASSNGQSYMTASLY